MTLSLRWTAEQVVVATRGHCLQEQTWQANGVSIDSRSVKEGDLFVALQGPTHDGHDYVAQAFSAGCSAAVVTRQPSNIPAGSPLIFVDDTLIALENLGQAGRQRVRGQILAVTGSVGKTSSKEMLRLMLGAVGHTYANEGSLNNHWGVPLSLARLPETADYGVFEIGMNHAGELGPLSKMVRPNIALITTIEAVHLEFFKSVEDIADAKAEIFQGLLPDGMVVLNRDNSYFARLVSAAKAHGLKNILSFGHDSKCQARMLNYIATPEGSQIKAEVNGRVLEYTLNVAGKHMAMNSLAALMAAAAAGGDLGVCATALAHYQQPTGRGVAQPILLADGSFTLIDESYNASPVAVRAAITVLSQAVPAATSGVRIIVLGDMKELGDSSPLLHASLFNDLIAHKIDRVYCCGPMMKYLYDSLPEAMRGAYADSSGGLIGPITEALHSGDIVTVKGSHSMNMKTIVDALKALGSTTLQSHQRAS